jgi:hypothetical protein
MPAAIPTMPCRNTLHRRDISFIGKVLETAGDERFLSVAARFQEAIAPSGAGQALYRGIMTALGYSKNKEAMAELAGRLPLVRLETAAVAGAPESECLAQYQARLIGTAGLLPSQRRVEPCAEYPVDEWVEKLENTWAAGGEKSVMSADGWRFFKVRPGNNPVRRLAAMSYLLLRYRKDGLLAGLQGILQAAADNAGHSLEASLLVKPDSFWGRYQDFGQPGGGVIPALLGKERAADIIINVLLPFAAAAGFIDAPPELTEKALIIYRAYRAPAENTLVTHMTRQLGIGRHVSDTARRQQGLMHIYKTRCSQGKCGECRLGEQ